MSIVLFSREIRSGKTTELGLWLKKKPGLRALLMPDRIGVRHFETYPINESWTAQWQASCMPLSDCLEIGRFRFSRQAFDRANAFLQEQKNDFPTFLAVDEVGKLELKGEGLFLGLNPLIKVYHESEDHTLLLVVRQELWEEFLQFFLIKNFTLAKNLNELEIRNIPHL